MISVHAVVSTEELFLNFIDVNSSFLCICRELLAIAYSDTHVSNRRSVHSMVRHYQNTLGFLCYVGLDSCMKQ